MFNPKDHPIITMIGGAILAAWIAFWRFVSALSTVDLMQTSTGRPSIGTFFLPRGLADGLTVLGVGLMVFAFLLLARRTDRAQPAHGTSEEIAELKAQLKEKTEAAMMRDVIISTRDQTISELKAQLATRRPGSKPPHGTPG